MPRAAVALAAMLAFVGACGSTPTSPAPPATPAATSTPEPSNRTAAAAPTAGTAPAASPQAPSGVAPSPTPVPAPAGGLLDRTLSAVRLAVGDATVDLVPDVVAGAAQLDGTADDGGGPGRLLVVVSPAGVTTRTNLCQDRDFVQGGSCKRVTLPGGDVLFRRGLVESGDVQTIVVAIARADGSGVLVESDNFRIELPPVLVAGQPHPTPTITRDGPVFTLDELVRVARAVSSATEGCTLARCR
jgi:hypothetical protein